MRRVEGQIRGIQRMIEEQRDCEAIVTQLLAARAALDKTGMLIMGKHIERCLISARDGDGPAGPGARDVLLLAVCQAVCNRRSRPLSVGG